MADWLTFWGESYLLLWLSLQKKTFFRGKKNKYFHVPIVLSILIKNVVAIHIVVFSDPLCLYFILIILFYE